MCRARGEMGMRLRGLALGPPTKRERSLDANVKRLSIMIGASARQESGFRGTPARFMLDDMTHLILPECVVMSASPGRVR